MLIDFDLPEELIAMHPSEKRDHCKMLVYDRSTDKIHHVLFHQLTDFIDSSYFLVLNQAKVNSCRMFWTDEKNKKQEILFLKNIQNENDYSVWEAIVSGKKIKVNEVKTIEPGFTFSLVNERKNSLALIRVNKNKAEVEKILEQKAQLPLPPYILKRRDEEGEKNYIESDVKDYQTVFSKRAGAVAAPTAGLHFTSHTFEMLKSKSIDWDFIHLSVGWGTFETLNETHFKTKKLHPEYVEIDSKTTRNILSAIERKKRILAVGTTSVRSLESWVRDGKNADGYQTDTQLFITPGDSFEVVGAMLTNFHIPQSSLLLLVAAFLGKEGNQKILEIYKEAIEKKYRFYSYGDCMLIL